jgi:cellulose synthase/poly-beta-1,6-N-acetylglucosamine synthase-like glycosyltransferase
MSELTTFFVAFTLLVFIANHIFTWRAWFTWKPDEVTNNEKPSVAILVPAFNEEINIVKSIESMLRQDYENLTIVVINDGSTDNTFNKVKESFNMKYDGKGRLNHNNIILIDKVNGGKGSALNAGFKNTDAEWVVCVDGDTILEKHAITTMISKRRKGVDAMASMVGIVNGLKFDDNHEIIEKIIPKGFWPRVQWAEYNRSYSLLRHSMKDLNAVTVIPGCCSMLSRKAMLETGGYKDNHLGEDMEITLNVHRQGGDVQFLSETLSWTEAPDNLRDLGKQRVRWFRGALQSFMAYRDLLFRKENKFFSWIILPYVWLADICGAWIELIGWIVAIYTIVTTSYDFTFFFILWGFIMLCHYINLMMSMYFIHRKLDKTSGKKIILFIALFEGITYHYLYVYWMLKAHIMELFSVKREWNKLDRKGF